MNHFNPNYFFDLSLFQHKKLFDEIQFVWEAIPKIKKYLNLFSLGVIETNVPKEAYLVDAHLISIGKGTTIEPGAYIKGPCIIGENCTIRHGAYIRGDLITGNRCVIGHDTEIKNSILLDNVHAAHFNYVGDSILGNHANVGAGAKFANLKLEGKEIFIQHDGIRYDTGLRKMGVILGDGSQIGCNVVTNPGTLMGKGVQCYPCLNPGGFIPSATRIKTQNSG